MGGVPSWASRSRWRQACPPPLELTQQLVLPYTNSHPPVQPPGHGFFLAQGGHPFAACLGILGTGMLVLRGGRSMHACMLQGMGLVNTGGALPLASRGTPPRRSQLFGPLPGSSSLHI